MEALHINARNVIAKPLKKEISKSIHEVQYSHGHGITRQVRTAMALPLTMAPDQSSQAHVATYRVSYSNAFLRLLGHKQFNSWV